MTKIDWVACERLIGSLTPKFLQDGFDLDDLKQEARVAILESHEAYSSEMGVSLNTYLGRRVRDALRTFVSNNSDTYEVSREWIAEPIADHPRDSIKAKTKAECLAIRDALGPSKYRTPRRQIETVHATVSLDDSTGDGDDAATLHEHVGVGPEQELGLIAAEIADKVLHSGGRNKQEFSEILRLRNEGHTFEQIAETLGKELSAVHKSFSRAQKRLAKKAA